ncbi:uncharacterized protein LOC143069100 [Mytilus galloprovincialis]|uniref:uncharacterized protein LOC143069100 n=1 Tax=Mytilus galloprovincialis TaxID=29158 RepID=UPI003F7B5A5F
MPCTVHNDQMYCAFCTDCDHPVCLDCLIESHQKHKYRKLNEVYEIAISEMKELQNKLESSQKFFGHENERLEKLLRDCDKNYQEIKDNILQTERDITETVSKYAKELLEDLESIWKPTEIKIKTEMSDIQKNIEDLVTREESLKKTLQSHQASEVFSSRKTLDKNLPSKSMQTINCLILNTKFISGNITKELNTRPRIFGDIILVPDVELFRTIQSDFRNVLDILNCDNNLTFIACHTERKLQKVKFEKNNNKLTVEEEFSINVRNMAKLKNDEILLATGESDIKVYSVDKKFKSYKSFSPLKTISIHVSKNNEIYVGLSECTPVTYPPTADSVRRVVVINQDGEIRNRYEYDKDNQRLFTDPWRIETLNDNIYIIDWVNKQKEGKVMALHNWGQLLWTYKGSDISSVTGKFVPIDLSATGTGMILVSDVHNHALHILNSAGEVIECKDLKLLGIELPFSLCFANNGVLWIGCGTRAAEKEKKAKIFAVRLVQHL